MKQRQWPCAAVLMLAACVDLSTDPDEIVAIEFPELPWPSVVAGDTLRNASGMVAPLVARLFDGEGREVAAGPDLVQFLSRDTTVTIEGGNLLVGVSAGGSAELLASGPGVQSIVRRIEVVRAPDSLVSVASADTLRWVIPDVPATNVSQEFRLRLRPATDTATIGVPAWVVSFRLEFQGAQVAPGDTSLVWLIGDGGRPSSADTTDAQGLVARRVRLRGGPGIPTTTDSVIVVAEATYRGAHVAGSPVRMVLPIKPR